jgi:hypothetical protein
LKNGNKWRAKTSPLFEIALVLMRFDHGASVIVNANHGIEASSAAASRLAVFSFPAVISRNSRKFA